MERLSGKRILSFVSHYDESVQRFLLHVPSTYTGQCMPLVLSPHPCTWSAEVDYENGPHNAVTRHPGWRGLLSLFPRLDMVERLVN